MYTNNKCFFRVSADNFKKIPGAPIAYWISDKMIHHFNQCPLLASIAQPRAGLATGDNSKFQRYWFEISIKKIGFNVKDVSETISRKEKWFPCHSGGEFKKWSTNDEFVVNWENNGEQIQKLVNSSGKLAARPQNTQWYFKEGITWNKLSSSKFAVKYKRSGFIFDDTSRSAFIKNNSLLHYYIGFLCSSVAFAYLKMLNPTMSFTNGDLEALPCLLDNTMKDIVSQIIRNNIEISATDWDRYETSWDFQRNPLIGCSQPVLGLEGTPFPTVDGRATPSPDRDGRVTSLAAAYAKCRQEWARDTVEMHRLEEENNRIFIEAYGLQDELTPDVPWNEITLTCNPWYRYGVARPSSVGDEGRVATPTVDGRDTPVADPTVDGRDTPVADPVATPTVDGRDTPVATPTVDGRATPIANPIADPTVDGRATPIANPIADPTVDGRATPTPAYATPELEARLKADTIKEFISYAVGCMMGRYSLDKPGLILANQGETLADYLKQVPNPSFLPDEDGVIPVLDEDWFDDDIVTRFHEFLKVTFGGNQPVPGLEDTNPDRDGRATSFYKNLHFIEEAIGKDLRSYFTKDFYKEHLQRYHNRPIYWLFSSPKGAFSALVYMHRYRPETAGIVLTYLRSHITKVTERIHNLDVTIDSADSTAGMKSKAIRERSKLQKNLQEMEDYERDVLYPLSTEKIAIDLDDGVKVNYQKFGKALRKVTGLDAKEE